MKQTKLQRVRDWFRSSITGRFVSRKQAAENKDTTQRETRRGRDNLRP